MRYLTWLLCFASLSQTITSSFAQSLAINAQGNIFLAAENGVHASKDNGVSWQMISELTLVNAITTNSSDHVFLGTGGSGIFRSTDDGQTFSRVIDDLIVFSLSINSNGHLFAGLLGSGGILRSEDNGESWSSVSGLFSDPNLVCNSISADGAGHIFAGLGWGFLRWGTVYRSSNNGENWGGFLNGLPQTDVFTAFCFNENGNVFSGSLNFGNSGSIFYSDDNGLNWIRKDNGLNNNSIRALAANGQDHLFAGTSSEGVFLSTDSGDIWVQVNNGLSDKRITSIVIGSNDHIFVKTSGSDEERVFLSNDNGSSWSEVFTLITNSVNAKNEKPFPESFTLEQNFPNPFNPSTTITYSLPNKDRVKIRVYNEIGQLVATLFDGIKQAGIHKIDFNANGQLNSGIYFYTLETSSFRQSKKMILLK